MTIIRSFFVVISYKTLTLTYDQSYLRLLVLKNGTRKIIYDNYKLIFRHDKLRICNLDL